MRHAPEVVEAVQELINANPDKSVRELTEMVNVQIHAPTPIKASFVNYLKNVKGKSKARKNNKAVSERPVKRTIADGELTFEGLLKKIEETGNYAKDLREAQRKAAEKLFLD